MIIGRMRWKRNRGPQRRWTMLCPSCIGVGSHGLMRRTRRWTNELSMLWTSLWSRTHRLHATRGCRTRSVYPGRWRRMNIRRLDWCPRCNAGPGRCSCPWWWSPNVVFVYLNIGLSCLQLFVVKRRRLWTVARDQIQSWMWVSSLKLINPNSDNFIIMRLIGKIYSRNLKNSRNLNLNISIYRDRSKDLRSRWKRRIKIGMDACPSVHRLRRCWFGGNEVNRYGQNNFKPIMIGT